MSRLLFHEWLLSWVCFCIMTFILSGCLISPKIRTNKWDYLRVVYLIRDENGKLQVQSWDTQNVETLGRLQSAFPRNGKYVVAWAPYMSALNRVDVKLRGGQWWSLSYLPNTGNIGMGDTSNWKRTFVLKNSKKLEAETFYTTLTNEIMRVSSIPIDLNIKYHKGEIDSLGTNNASWYKCDPEIK